MKEVETFLTLISIVGMTTSSRSLICMMGWSAGMGIASIIKQRHEGAGHIIHTFQGKEKEAQMKRK